MRRIIDKLDECVNKKDYEGAERHLIFWMKEAEAEHDVRKKLLVLNEQIGLYRKIEKENECLKAADEVLTILKTEDVIDKITYATSLINVATGYKAFGNADKAVPLYRQAQEIYEAALYDNDSRLGGLYNNMALALTDIGDYEEARQTYEKAIEVMQKQQCGEPECAITYLNLADLVAAQKGIESGEKEICSYLDKAEKLLDSENIPRDGYYAFVCEKCAPVFGHYGYFVAEKKLSERAEKINEGA